MTHPGKQETPPRLPLRGSAAPRTFCLGAARRQKKEPKLLFFITTTRGGQNGIAAALSVLLPVPALQNVGSYW